MTVEVVLVCFRLSFSLEVPYVDFVVVKLTDLSFCFYRFSVTFRLISVNFRLFQKLFGYNFVIMSCILIEEIVFVVFLGLIFRQ